MKIVKFELSILGIVLLLLSFGLVQLNFARYNYTYVIATMIDKDWLGDSYVVKEVNFQNRCFEKGSVSLRNPKWDVENKILSEYPFFLTSLDMGTKSYFYPGTLIEICLDLKGEKIFPISEGIFHKEYKIDYILDLQYARLSSDDPPVDDYYIEFSSKLEMVGITTEKYRMRKIREFVLFRSLDLIQEYSGITELHSISGS